MIDRHYGSRINLLIVDVRDNSHNPARLRVEADEFRKAVGPHQMAIDWILSWKQLIRDASIDDDNALCTVSISGIEIASGNERDAKSGKESRRHRTQSRTRIVLRIARVPAFNGKRQSIASAPGISPRNSAPDGHAFNSRDRHQSLLKLAIKFTDLF